MATLISADLHFTDNPRDEHRWNLIPWIAAQVSKYSVDEVLLLGDITDAKDRHSSRLVNRLVIELYKLASACSLYILAGNHDSLDPTCPFFGFMHLLPSVTFITTPSSIELGLGECLFLPSTHDWRTDWKGIDFNDYDYVFTHATFDGCTSESGIVLNGGIPPSVFKDFKGKVVSGDIHMPQKMGKNIEYVGAPYRVRFGDIFTPRVLLLDHDKHRDLHFPTIKKHVVTIQGGEPLTKQFDALAVQPSDMVKLRVRLTRAQYPDWPKLRQAYQNECREMGIDLYGPELLKVTETARTNSEPVCVSVADALDGYIKRKKLSQSSAQFGRTVLKEVNQ